MKAIIFFVLYVGTCIIIFKDLGSISQSYYEWEKKQRHSGIIFTLWALMTVFLILPEAMTKASGSWEFLIFIAAAALGFVGCAPLYDGEIKNREKKDILQSKTHYIGAIICMLSSTLWVLVDTQLFYIPIISNLIAVIIWLLLKKERLMLLLEIAAFASFMLGIILK